MTEATRRFLEVLRAQRNYSPNTVAAYGRDLHQLEEFLARTTGNHPPVPEAASARSSLILTEPTNWVKRVKN